VKKYANATDIVWCQDEPQNQGAWFFIQHNIHENMREGQKLGYSGRAASASPAVGYAPAPRATKGTGGRRIRQAQGLCPDQVIQATPLSEDRGTKTSLERIQNGNR
jgi:hypothetical protein